MSLLPSRLIVSSNNYGRGFFCLSLLIAAIIGTTKATIAQYFVTLKRKAFKLSEEAQAQVLHIAD